MNKNEPRQKTTNATLPKPGLVGIAIRLALAVAVGFIAYDAITDAPDYWNGFSGPADLADRGVILAVLVLFSSPMVNELVLRDWKMWPAVFLVSGAVFVAGVGALRGDPLGPAFGIYTWLWVTLWSVPMAVAFVLAAAMRTPGCEINAFRQLVARLKGHGADYRACPGFVDCCDSVRVFDRW